MVSQNLLNELKIIFKEDYGMDLKQNETAEIGNTLVNFFDLLEKIKSENEYENIRSPNNQS